ncbi:MAG: hypothetical protein P4M15_05480 [Alphaproteobacteria bacterium]|nr:hypothetical protein [Alphaproteobacteria bacterium]
MGPQENSSPEVTARRNRHPAGTPLPMPEKILIAMATLSFKMRQVDDTAEEHTLAAIRRYRPLLWPNSSSHNAL